MPPARGMDEPFPKEFAMKFKKVVFAAPWKVEVQEEEFSLEQTPANGLCLKNCYSLISPGTELACLSGLEDWFKLPNVHGYTAISEIVAVGSGVQNFKVGEKVFHYGRHQAFQFVAATDFLVKVPDGLLGEGMEKMVPFTRLITIAMTALRVSEIELGDTVAVTGLGLIGNLAAQLAGLQGGRVIGIDLSDKRAALAKRCGIGETLNPAQGNLREKVLSRTGGAGVETFIEATGVPKVFADNLELVGKSGEAILLGSPRGECHTDLTALLNHSHLWNQGCVTIKGAHEWRYPLEKNDWQKHSFHRNSVIAMDLVKNKKLLVEPLLTHTVRPEDSPGAYEGLRRDKENYMGVVIDWN